MLVNKNLLGLYNGVSQQPASIRLDSQCELQENAVSSLVDGLFKRPPTEIVTSLVSNASVSSGVHYINRDANEKYTVIFTDDATEPIEVYTLAGVKQNVKYGHLDEDLFFTEDLTLKNYLTCTTPRTDLKAVTVADYTLITNKTKTCLMTEVVDEPVTYEALVYSRTAGTTISTEVNVDAIQGASSGKTGTKGTITALLEALEIADVHNYYTFTRLGSSMKIVRVNGADFTFSVHDNWGEMALYGFKGAAQNFQDLPAVGFNGMVMKIMGSSANSYDDYYVRFTTETDETEGYKTGVWKEHRKQGLCNHIDNTTMPHRLVRIADGEFVFADIEYAERMVGDEVTAAEPSFIGNTINDIFFHKNRLGFICGENAILSKSGEFWQFFPSTIMDNLDDDPIDVAVSSNQVTVLHHAIPFNKDLVLFSEQQQFVLHAGTNGGLTPQNAACDLTTAFSTSPDCAPVASGAMVYFVVPEGDFTAVREYYVNSDSLTNDAADVTAHCPNYIPSGVYKLAACPSLDIIFALSTEEPQNIYVYKYHWRGEEKAQSAWSKWTLSTDIINMAVVDNYLYLLTTDDNGVHIEKMNLKKAATEDCSFRIHLDRQQIVVGTYDEGTDLTTFTVGDYYDSTVQLVYTKTGAMMTTPVITGGVFTLAGDYSNMPMCIGIPYTMKYRFSEWFVKSENNANLAGVLKMRKVDIGFSDTGYIKVSVTPLNRDALVHEYTAHVVGVSKFDEADILTGTKSFLLMCNSKGSIVEISNDTYLPSEIHAANFEGFFTTRSRVI